MNRLLVRSLVFALAVLFAQSLVAAGPQQQQPGPSVSFGLLPISKAQSPNNMVDPQGKSSQRASVSTQCGTARPWVVATRSSSSFVSSHPHHNSRMSSRRMRPRIWVPLEVPSKL
jgi:hypothetical protein